MWRADDAQGALVYPNFVETLNAIRPMYWMRLIGGPHVPRRDGA